jgi:hypothetical protein
MVFVLPPWSKPQWKAKLREGLQKSGPLSPVKFYINVVSQKKGAKFNFFVFFSKISWNQNFLFADSTPFKSDQQEAMKSFDVCAASLTLF